LKPLGFGPARACRWLISFAFATMLSGLAPEVKAAKAGSGVSFSVSFPETVCKEALDGRLLLLLSTNETKEPRFQISEEIGTQQVFGRDVAGLKPGQSARMDATAFGYPLRSLAQVPPGEYWVQALLHRYETFHRADGHVLKLPMDRGEG